MCRKEYFPTAGMNEKEILNYYLNKAKEKFKEGLFDYSLITSVKKRTDTIQIICSKHGIIDTTFNNHLSSETGCFQCGDERGRNSKRMTFSELIIKLNKVNPNPTYRLISREIKTRKIKTEHVYVQDEFGICKITIGVLLRGGNPNVKSAIFPDLYIINKYRKINGFKYDYSNSKYTKALDSTTINCRKHGKFKTKPNWHLQGRGCPHCSEESRGVHLKSNTKDFIKKSQ